MDDMQLFQLLETELKGKRPSKAQRNYLQATGLVDVFEGVKDEWYFNIKRQRSGEIITSSEGYTSEKDAWRGVWSVLKASAVLMHALTEQLMDSDEIGHDSKEPVHNEFSLEVVRGVE